jgi:small subunit ribosomal protein S10
MIKIYVKLKSFHPIYLDRFLILSQKKLKEAGILESKIIFLPKKSERFTVLRSPHVDKKARDQFERVTYKRLLVFKFELNINNSYLKLYKILKFLSTLAIGVNFDLQYIIAA